MTKIVHVLLAGGSGTRLWPLSRQDHPKQFLNLFDGHSLFQKTLQRHQDLCDQQIIVCNQDHYFLAQTQLDERPNSELKPQFLLEPCGKNTAPAIALAAFKSLKDQANNADPILIVTPSDHLIENQTAYQADLQKAIQQAESEQLVCLGIPPTFPSTEFGYIDNRDPQAIRFIEKPNKTLAADFIKQGHYFWNAGIFCFRAQAYLDALKTHSPEIYQCSYDSFKNAIKKAAEKTHQQPFLRINAKEMVKIPANSIDYAVMEKASNISMIKASFDWQDIGSLDALTETLSTHSNHQQAIILQESLHKPAIINQTKYPIIAIDAEDMMIVQQSDALLVCKKGSGHKLKRCLPEIKRQYPSTLKTPSTVNRPWGKYRVIEQAKNSQCDNASGYKIKHLEVQPGQSLSLQAHQNRAEHWVILSGLATVTLDGKTLQLNPNQAITIPQGAKHQLANLGDVSLLMIEVQVGQSTEEDDIIRFTPSPFAFKD